MAALLPDLQIQSSLANYTVGFSDLTELSRWQPEADVLLVDAFFRDRLSLPEDRPVIWIEANEEAKSLPATMEVFMALKQAGMDRSSQLAAIGGGVVQDIATFVSSLYMRGIRWHYVPTTFLGMTDSCLGGKSSINVGPYKNLIGNFHPPRRIDLLPVFARTLPAVEIACGAAEAAKISFCRGTEAFATYEQLAAPVLEQRWTEHQLAALLHVTLSVKKWFIEIDEFDKAERRLLNFGHTWGHALESATAFAIPHGLAVAVGMMASICFTGQPREDSRLWSHCLQLICPVLNTEACRVFDAERFRSAFRADKKHSPGHYHLIVPSSSSQATLGVEEVVLPADDKTLQAVQTAMEEALQALEQEIASGRIPVPATR